MTTQLARGARAVLNRLEDEVRDAREATQLADQHRLDPVYVHDRLVEIEDALARLTRAMRDELEPILQRRDPSIEQRLLEIERRLGIVEHELRKE